MQNHTGVVNVKDLPYMMDALKPPSQVNGYHSLATPSLSTPQAYTPESEPEPHSPPHAHQKHSYHPSPLAETGKPRDAYSLNDTPGDHVPMATGASLAPSAGTAGTAGTPFTGVSNGVYDSSFPFPNSELDSSSCAMRLF